MAPGASATRSLRLVAAGGAALLAAVAIAIGTAGLWRPAQAETAPITREDAAALAAMNVDDHEQILAEGTDAQDRNAAILPSGLPLQKVRSLDLGGASKATYDNALKCLTEAVYYEAANEPLEGRRAVAQVVLNRVRHPAYPKSVCGVVYQGYQKWTGCQFSFTCDGSLTRSPMRRQWLEAESVARAALAGYVEPSVGTATHYHADYVLPKWAFQLGKIEQIGRHIFYRFTGSWGNSSAFLGRYSGQEIVPQIDFAALRERLNARALASTEEPLVPGLTVTPHVSDRHAANDVGGRIDMTKSWRLAIPDPVQASSHYRQAVAEEAAGGSTAPGELAMASSAAATVTP